MELSFVLIKQQHRHPDIIEFFRYFNNTMFLSRYMVAFLLIKVDEKYSWLLPISKHYIRFTTYNLNVWHFVKLRSEKMTSRLVYCRMSYLRRNVIKEEGIPSKIWLTSNSCKLEWGVPSMMVRSQNWMWIYGGTPIPDIGEQ